MDELMKDRMSAGRKQGREAGRNEVMHENQKDGMNK